MEVIFLLLLLLLLLFLSLLRNNWKKRKDCSYHLDFLIHLSINHITYSSIIDSLKTDFSVLNLLNFNYNYNNDCSPYVL